MVQAALVTAGEAPKRPPPFEIVCFRPGGRSGNVILPRVGESSSPPDQSKKTVDPSGPWLLVTASYVKDMSLPGKLG